MKYKFPGQVRSLIRMYLSFLANVQGVVLTVCKYNVCFHDYKWTLFTESDILDLEVNCILLREQVSLLCLQPNSH